MNSYREITATTEQIAAATTGLALATRTNTHKVVEIGGQQRIICKLNSDRPLPKGEIVPAGPCWIEVDGEQLWTGLTGIVCNACNKVNPYGR